MQRSKRLIAAAALVLSMSPLAHADPSSTNPDSWMALLRMDPMDAMHLIDTGNKGKVSKAEFMKFQEGFFARMDKNKDGFVSVQEWMAKLPY